MIEAQAFHVFVQVKGQDGVFMSVPAFLHSEENATYKENFKSLEKLVLVMAEDDTMVHPKESEHFGYFKDGSRETLVAMRDAPWYTDDWFGLKSLDQDKKIDFFSTPGNHLRFKTDFLVEMVRKLTEHVQRDPLSAGLDELGNLLFMLIKLWDAHPSFVLSACSSSGFSAVTVADGATRVVQAQPCRSSSESPCRATAAVNLHSEAIQRPWRHSREFDPNPRSPIWRSSAAPEPLVWARSPAGSMLYSSQDGGPNLWQQEAFSEAAESLVAGELAQIYQLVKAKSDRMSQKEAELHRSECVVAEAVVAAKVHLREELDELLRSSQRELRKEASVQRRRLEELFQKAQEEFRKAVEWRREARTLKGTVNNEIETREKLQKKVQELLRREKALKQQHELERKRWAEEKEQLQKQALHGTW
ncbi:ppt-1 [Symbiodinium sp. CCMP2456]|nr:ppt-1 [Symbiodinium sp. CCMP2456]